MSEQLRSLVAAVTATIREKRITAAEAHWEMATTGTPEAAERASKATRELALFLSDRKTFAELTAAREKPTGDRLLDRQVDLLYYGYLENQLDEAELTELVDRSTKLQQVFATFRGTVDGRKVGENEIREVLVTSTDSAARRKAWEASKQIGAEVAPKLVELVRLRNAAARRLGFRNYYEMQLELQEIKPDELFALMDRLKALTDGPFAAMKAELDAEQAKRFGIAPEEMRPWHYADPFFQELPASGGVNTDRFFEGKSLEELAVRFYDGVGLEVRDILERSDLYEREGKNQHAFCMDANHEGDVRVLCNLKPNDYWMATLLHELGHAVYFKYLDMELPWLLREPAHISSTEAVAMYFGRLTRDADWLHRIAGVPEAEAQAAARSLREQLARRMLLLARWVLVMVHFEARLYENPEQDLNRLWWNLVEELQLVRRPENLTGHEWATKIHLTIAPVYYHNYLLGELTASHLQAHIARETGSERIAGNREVGQWLVERFFRPGATYPWNELLEKVTGERLNPQYFVDQFVR